MIIQLKASELSIIDFFKGFKYKIALAILLSKVKSRGETEYCSVYFNSSTKTVISDDYKLDQAFKEIIYRLKIGFHTDQAGLLKKFTSST